MDRQFWTLENLDSAETTNPHWVGLVSEPAGGIIAVGRRDVIVTLADLLETAAESEVGYEYLDRFRRGGAITT